MITQTRKLRINWDKVLLLARQTKTKQTQEFPHPYGQIQTNKTGTVLGKTQHARTETTSHPTQTTKRQTNMGHRKENYSKTKQYRGNYEYIYGTPWSVQL